MYVDLSHVLGENTPVYPGDVMTKLDRYKELDRDGYQAFLLYTGLHTGTHIDLPQHFFDDPRDFLDFPVNNFIARGVLLDVRNKNIISMREEYRHLIKARDAVLLFTGHDIYYHEDRYFQNYPVIDEELACFFIESQVSILGMDTPAPDYVPFTLHKQLLEHNIFLLENMTNLSDLLGKQFELISFPLKLQAEASPVRAVARLL